MKNLCVFILILLPCTVFAQRGNTEWVQETSKSERQARDSQGEVVYKDRLWIFGGWFNSYEAPPRDVWSSTDGKNWILVKMWIMGAGTMG